MEKLLFGKDTAPQALRIARGGAMPATAHLTRHADKMKRIASLSQSGGILLTGVGVTAACMQIAHTQDKKEKNEIFVETLTSTVVGGVGGYLVGAFLVINPVTWGAVIVLATGTTLTSYIAGKGVSSIYSTWFGEVDLVNGLGVNTICK